MKVLCTLIAVLFSSLMQAKSLSNIVIFGDSLSDNGNLYKLYEYPPSPPYYKGRFSNGPIWAEILAQSYFFDTAKAHLQDYALGGAAIAEKGNDEFIALDLEISTYLAAHQGKANESTLFVIWIGANNYLSNPSEAEDALANVNKGIQSNLERLREAGARHIMLVNLPDLGTAPDPFPEDLLEEDQPAFREKLSSYCQRHNELLANTVSELKQKYSKVQWLYFDVGSKFKEFLAAPEIYGITNTKDACYSSKANKFTKNPMLTIASKLTLKAKQDSCEGYLFFDGVHPTAAAHKIIAAHAQAYLEKEGVEFNA